MTKHILMTSHLKSSNKSSNNPLIFSSNLAARARASGLKALFLLSLLIGIGLLFHIINVSHRMPIIPWRAKGRSPSSDQDAELPLRNRLLNISNFKYRRNNKFICRTSPGDTQPLPVLVHSSRAHSVERQAIRQSWGSLQNNYRNFSVRPVFLMGEARPGGNLLEEFHLEQKLDKAHRLHKDLITGSFVDTYKNLTYKHMMGYKWILEHCPQAQFALKADDDMFVDISRFIDARLADIESESGHHPKDLYCCHVVSTKPIRDQTSKWFVPFNEFPADETYPGYCSGSAYGITVDWIRKLYRMSQFARYFWVDDVFATGILTGMAKLAFRERPIKISSHCEWYDMRGRTCSNIIGDDGNSSGRFAAVVQLRRNELFGNEMGCLWNNSVVRFSTKRRRNQVI